MTTALIVSTNSAVEEKIRSALANEQFKVYTSSSLPDSELAIRTLLPAVIFLDLDIDTAASDLANKLKKSPITKEVTVIALSLNDSDTIRELALANGADSFIPKPFLPEEILYKTKELLSKRGKFTTSYTAQFVRALINYTQSSYSSNRILNIGHQICRALEVDIDLEKDILQASRLLASAANDGNSDRVIRFYEEMGFAKVVLAILKNSPKESLPSAIAWALFANECQKLGTNCKKIDFGALKGVYTQTKELYESTVVVVENPSDLTYAKDEFFNSFSSDLANDKKEYYYKAVGKILTHMLTYHDGSVMFRENSQIIIKPKDRQVSSKCIERINCFDEELSSRTHIKPLARGGAIAFELGAIEHKPSAPLPQKAATISAIEFLKTAPIDANELEELRLLEEDIFELLEELSYSHNTADLFQEINALLASYGSHLITINEFSQIARAIIEFSLFVRSLERVEDENIKRASVIVSALVEDLRSWRKSIFVERSATDIHFLDDTIIANCNQCVSSL